MPHMRYKKIGLNFAVILIVVSVLCTILDGWFYVRYLLTSGYSLYSLFNPIAMCKYIATPIGVLLRLVILSPYFLLIFLVFFIRLQRTEKRDRG